MTTDRRAVTGALPPPFPLLDIANAASTSGHSIPSGLALQPATTNIVPGGAEGVDEGHVGLIEPLLPVNCHFNQ
jgi:hypothetical protein